jgi:hypothetical protein
MPPSLKLMRLNSKIKPGEYYYFMCRCEKPKAVQQKCKECGKTWEKKKELSEYEVKDKEEKKSEDESDNESDNKSDNESNKESESAIGGGDNYIWYDDFNDQIEIDESHIIEYIIFNCDECGETAGFIYRYNETEPIYVIAYYDDCEDEGMWKHFPTEEGYDDCNDNCYLCDEGDEDTPHLRVGRNHISGIFPSNYRHYSEDPVSARILQELIG